MRIKFEEPQKALVVFSKIEDNKLNKNYKGMTAREFISFMQREELKEGILSIKKFDDKMVVVYR